MAKPLKTLRALRVSPKEWEAIEAQIADLFRTEIYLPLLKSIGAPKAIQNSAEDLRRAIASGQIQYIKGHFQGQFNAAISKELRNLGALWDNKRGWWKIHQANLTMDMRAAIGVSQSKFDGMARDLNKKIESISPEYVASRIKIDKLIDSTIYKTTKDFDESVKAITIPPKFTDYQRKRISAEYTYNMQLEIKNFTEGEIQKLREQVQATLSQGIRRESLVKMIQESYGVSQNKAKSLARQETNLLVTKIHQTRYQEAGLPEYVWTNVAGSPAHPVRPSHKKLHGKIFRWSDPPIMDDGQKKNPGQDYGCRCTARPVVRF